MADQNNLVTIQQSPSTSQINNSLPSVLSSSNDIIQDLIINNNNNNNKDDDMLDEPDIKRKKLNEQTQSSSSSSATSSSASKKFKEQSDKLEFRLNGILSCAVCLDLPNIAMFQCQLGHLMCAMCFTHLLADGRLRDQVATCPNCRVEISKTTATRNLAVEKAVSELPSECQYCGEQFPTRSLACHQELYCEERPTNCSFNRIGCQWRGPLHEVKIHEANCIHPKKTGAEVMQALETKDKDNVEDKKMFSVLIDLLSYEKILFNDLQLKPYRTDEYVHKLYYETSKFSAFNHQWVVKARINNSQKDPHQSNERQITYQLILKTKTNCRLYIQYFVLKGPFSDIKVNTQIYKKCFTDEENETEYVLLPLTDSTECNRLLAAKTINFRLIMFQVSP